MSLLPPFSEVRYGITVHRLPHWQLGRMFRNAVFRPPSRATACPNVDSQAVFLELRKRTGLDWIATGEKACDSLERLGMLSVNQGVDEKTKRFFPVAWFSHKAIWTYLKAHRILLPPDYALFGRSFGRLRGPELMAIKRRFPEDYERILEVFPYAEAAVKREEFYGS